MSNNNNIILFTSKFTEDTNSSTEEKVQHLTEMLNYERKLREASEAKSAALEEEIKFLKESRFKKNNQRKEPPTQAQEYTEYKSNGIIKAHAADPIRSYDDFVAIQNYFLSKNNIRDWMLWTVGVSLGLRVSDLLRIKYKDILNPDFTFKKRIKTIEKKTNKLNNCLITESVIFALTKYLDSIHWEIDLDKYLFVSRKTRDKLTERHGWKIISNAGKALRLPLNVGSHTMRKSFANIAACVDKSSVDMNSLTKIQGLLNHGDQKVTMRYLGTFQDMYDKARVAVSDFILGKTQINKLEVGNSCTLDDLLLKLDTLESKFFSKAENRGIYEN